MTSLDIFKYILNGFEIAACVAGFVSWNKIKNSHWKWFPFYLTFIVLAEFTGKYFTYTHMDDPKKIMYDYIVIPAEILFYLAMFYNEFRNSKFARLPALCIIVYVACLFIDSFYLQNKYDWFLSFSYAVGVLLIVINILIFLFQLATSQQVIYFRTNLTFWVCVGLLLFYLASLPFQGIMTYLFAKHNSTFRSYAYTFYVFDCLMYLSFIIGFICGKVRTQDF